uniref:Potassium channel toxin n=1 Tax=Hemiscorpius lepturus TaxID=520031 RepID=A0A1L4BJ33_HEMLE|nr:potassium channel toxin [Hemiscorpius lepturus]
MNKAFCAIFLVLLIIFAVSVLPAESTGGCPSDSLCKGYCKKNKYGNEGKCDGTNCKCSIG